MELPGRILWSIIRYELFWDAILSKDALEMINNRMGCSTIQLSDDGEFAVLI